MIDDKTSVRRANPPAAVCKNCWSQPESLNHWENDEYRCDKPTQRLAPIEKWWAWYEAFCGPRTAEAAESLETLVGEEQRQLSHQLPIRTRLQLQPTSEISNSQPSAMEPPCTEVEPVWNASISAFDITPPSDSQPIPLEFSLSPQPSPMQVNMQLNNIGNNHHNVAFMQNAASLYPEYSSMHNSEGLPDQNMAQGSQYSTRFQWHQQASNYPNFTPSGPITMFQGQLNDVSNLMAQLQLEREKNRRLGEKNLQLKECCKTQLEIIKNLSTKIPPNQIMGQPLTEARNDYYAPTRSSTHESTYADLSGIAAPDAPTTETLDDFMADLSPSLTQPFQQDMQDTQYLTEENSIPHNNSRFPSIGDDSGYDTLPMDTLLDSPVAKRFESTSASFDSSLVPPHP
jgi:hypothetical protein